MLASSDGEKDVNLGVPDAREWNGDAEREGAPTSRPGLSPNKRQQQQQQQQQQELEQTQEATQRLMRIMRSKNGGGDLSAIHDADSTLLEGLQLGAHAHEDPLGMSSHTRAQSRGGAVVAELDDDQFGSLIGGVVKRAVDKALGDVIRITDTTPRVDAGVGLGGGSVQNRFEHPEADRDVSLLLQRGKTHWRALELGMQETQEQVSHTVSNLTRFKQQQQAQLASHVGALKKDFRLQMASLQRMFLGEAQDLVEQLKDQVQKAKEAHVRTVNRQVNILVDQINGGSGEDAASVSRASNPPVPVFAHRPLRAPGALFSPPRRSQQQQQQQQVGGVLGGRNQNLDNTLRSEVYCDDGEGATQSQGGSGGVSYKEKLQRLGQFDARAGVAVRDSQLGPSRAVREWARAGSNDRVEISDQSFARATAPRSSIRNSMGLTSTHTQHTQRVSFAQMKKLDFLPSSSSGSEHDGESKREGRVLARFGRDAKRQEQLSRRLSETARAVDKEQEHVSPGKSRKARKLYQAYTRRRQLRQRHGDVLHSSSDEDQRTRDSFNTNFRRTYPSPRPTHTEANRASSSSSRRDVASSRSSNPYPSPRKQYAHRLKQIHDTLFHESSDDDGEIPRGGDHAARARVQSPSGVSHAFQEHLLRLHNRQ